MGSSALPTVYLERSFFPLAETLRAQLDGELAPAGTPGFGRTVLAYDYAPELYQCLTAPAICVFSQDTLATFIQKLSVWSQEKLGAAQISTPSLQIYIGGCGRRLVRDEAQAKWHYLFCLTSASRRQRTVIRILHDPGSTGAIRAGKVSRINPQFNELLVHEVEAPYAIDAKTSMNPLQGAVFLTSYLW
jgi:hypothetical protein